MRRDIQALWDFGSARVRAFALGWVMLLIGVVPAFAQQSLVIESDYKISTDTNTRVSLNGNYTNRGDYEGNLEFNGNGTQLLSSPDAEVFQNLMINNLGNVLITTPVTVTDTLFLLSGQLDNSLHDLTVATVVRESGELTDPPQFTQIFDLIYDGINPTVTGPEMPPVPQPLNNLIINNPGGVTLSADVILAGSLQFQQGHLYTDVNTALLGPTAMVTGETSNHYLIGNLYTERFVGANASNFGGIGLTITQGSANVGDMTVTRMTGSTAAVDIFGHPSIQRRWQIESDNPPGPSGRQLQFSWLSADDNAVNLSHVQAWRQRDDGFWEGIGSVQDASSTRTVQATATQFSDWTITDLAGTNVTGDVNLDGQFDQADIDLVVSYILGLLNFSSYELFLADQNVDNIIDAQDVIALVDLLP